MRVGASPGEVERWQPAGPEDWHPLMPIIMVMIGGTRLPIPARLGIAPCSTIGR